MAAKFTPPIRHYLIADSRRQYEQSWSTAEAAEAERVRWIHRVNAAYKPWEPLLAFGMLLVLGWVAIKAIPVLWSALYVLLAAVGSALS